jgi:AraC family transcriptional regulator, regulatory protein of adaptative response / methylated-DNA-[protein]-cysteine methyltransferase
MKKSAGDEDAVRNAGFGWASRSCEQAGAGPGMTPGRRRGGARGISITYAGMDSPAGRLMLAATARGVCSVQLGESDEALLDALRREFPAAGLRPMEAGSAPEFLEWVAALNEHLAGARPRLELPLDVHATAFQMQVWQYLQGIPAGATQSYAEVARALGRAGAARAVARACASNRLAVVIPCHRVIRGDGGLGGFRWGLDRKRELLASEAAVSPQNRR